MSFDLSHLEHEVSSSTPNPYLHSTDVDIFQPTIQKMLVLFCAYKVV